MRDELDIRVDDLTGQEIAQLLEAHLDLMRASSPPESVHALDLSKLRQPEITFWSAYHNDQLVGCIALKVLNEKHGEIKSMHVAKSHRGQGIAEALLTHLEKNAVSKGLTKLSLETGTPEPFHAAQRLYERAGYRECGPFADYVEDSFSMFMTKSL